MGRLLIFNPENDLALASNALSYTPTAAAAALRQSGLLLPLWWSQPGDQLLVPRQLFPAAMALRDRWHLPGLPVIRADAATAMPWGWSRSIRRELQALGVADLPSDDQVQIIRALSHRRTSIALLRALGTPDEMMPREFDSPDHAIDAIDAMSAAVLKMPWSGSGRGVFHTSRISRAMTLKTIRDVIQRQGSIIVEHELNRLRDFATLYHSDGLRVQYRGLSLFINDSHGHYRGNLIIPQHMLARQLGLDIEPLAARIADILTPVIAPHYSGWFGVDMMLHTLPSGATAIWPCVEINLRLTMGVLALYLAERALQPGHTAQFIIGTSTPPDAINISPTPHPVSFTLTPGPAPADNITFS